MARFFRPFPLKYPQEIALVFGEGGSGEAPCKLQGDSYNSDIAESKLTTKLPYHTPMLREMDEIQNTCL